MKFGPPWAEIDWQQENLLGAFKEIQTKLSYATLKLESDWIELNWKLKMSMKMKTTEKMKTT